MKKLFLIMALVSFIGSNKAQNTEPESSGFKFDVRNLTFGGGLGLQFGDYTHIDISSKVVTHSLAV